MHDVEKTERIDSLIEYNKVRGLDTKTDWPNWTAIARLFFCSLYGCNPWSDPAIVHCGTSAKLAPLIQRCCVENFASACNTYLITN